MFDEGGNVILDKVLGKNNKRFDKNVRKKAHFHLKCASDIRYYKYKSNQGVEEQHLDDRITNQCFFLDYIAESL